MNLLERKQKIRNELKVLNNSVEASVMKIQNFDVFSNSNIWAVFKPLKDEPILKDFPKNVKLCSPRTDLEVSLMSFVLDGSAKSFSKSSLGVEEPVGGDKITKDQIDLMFIPGVAFDHSGNRLGRGKGFYDRYLADYKGVKIGVCSKNRLVDFPLPTDPEFDVQVDFILTEDFVYQPVGKTEQEKVV